MDKILPALGTLSLGGGLVICLLALLSRLSRARYAARWRCWVWVLLCLRLSVPVQLSLPGPATPPIQLPAPPNTVIYTPGVTLAPDVSEPEQQPPATGSESSSSGYASAPAPSPAPVRTETPGRPVTLLQAAGAIWALGTAGMLGWLLWSHLRFLRHLRRWSRAVEEPEVIQLYHQLGDLLQLQAQPPVRRCPGLPVPMLVGILRPTLLLPDQDPVGDGLRFSMLHELTHYRRRDLVLKALALWVNAAHWFNPAVWYMVRLVERDMELACDEAALEVLPREEHGLYGKTILDAVQRLGRRAPAGERRSP